MVLKIITSITYSLYDNNVSSLIQCIEFNIQYKQTTPWTKKKKRKSQIWIQDLNLNSSNSSFKKNQKKNKTKPGADGTLNQGPDVQNYKDFPTDHIDIFKLQQ